MINRRTFVSNSFLSTAGMLLIGASRDDRPAKYDIMKEVARYRKIDAHGHVNLYDGPPENNIAMADRLHIERMVVSRPITSGEGTPAEFREYNNLVMAAVKKYPNRFIGQFTVNPIHQKESLEEIKRCVDNGMKSLKVYTQVKINDPLFYPIIEKMADLKMIIHMHSHCQLGLGGYRMKYDTKIRPNTSIPEDFVDAAKRYPQSMFQYAHIGGGGDWEYACKSFVDYPNIYVDTSGSNNPEYMIDFALQQLGEDRLLFGTDNCYYQSIGKVLASKLTDVQRRKLFFDNYNSILKKSGNDID